MAARIEQVGITKSSKFVTIKVVINILISNCFSILQKIDPEKIFTKHEKIGEGSFGEVFKGLDNRTQQVSLIFHDF